MTKNSTKTQADYGYKQSNDKVAKTFLTICTVLIVGLIIGTFVFLFGGSNSSEKAPIASNTNTIQEDSSGKQILDLTAGNAGYTPRTFTAKAGKPILLKVATKNSFSCANALVFSSLGISKNLPSTGTTEIELPAQQAGTTVRGTFSMGMFGVDIKIEA